MKQNNEVEKALEITISSDELINITKDFAEVGLDSLLSDGILKDVPIIGTMFSLAKIGVSINDRIFCKKVLHFLFQIKDIPKKNRFEFVERINNDKKFNTKVSESLILLIDKFNDYSKAEYLGKLFSLTIQEKIDYTTFLKLSNIIDKAFIPDLKNLIAIYKEKNNEVDETEMNILYTLGLLNNLGVDGQTFIFQHGENTIPKKRNNYEINKYGQILVEEILLK